MPLHAEEVLPVSFSSDDNAQLINMGHEEATLLVLKSCHRLNQESGIPLGACSLVVCNPSSLIELSLFESGRFMNYAKSGTAAAKIQQLRHTKCQDKHVRAA